MSEPVGIQRTRAKVQIVDGVRHDLQWQSKRINGLSAKCVTRGTVWGNPFVIGKVSECLYHQGELVTSENCLVFYEEWARDIVNHFSDWLEPLRGYNLACFCPIGSPCHRSILLNLLKETEATNAK